MKKKVKNKSGKYLELIKTQYNIDINSDNFINIIKEEIKDSKPCGITLKDTLVFEAERYCFRGSIDDWLYLDSSSNLRELAKKMLYSFGERFFLRFAIFGRWILKAIRHINHIYLYKY